jgi:hypothetical protein
VATNIVDIAILSPFQFTKRGYVNPLPYNTKYRDDWQYIDTIGIFDEVKEYLQPWEKVDIIPFQIISNYAPHQLELYDCQGNQIDVFNFDYVVTSIDVTGQKVYEATIALNGYDEGVYRFIINSGSPVLETYESSFFYLKQLHEGTLLLETTHDENDYDTVFENGFVAKLRIHGEVGDYLPGSERTLFIDQPNNITQLKGGTFSVESLIIGDQYGVPDYMIEKINQHFQCKTVLVDGKQYVGNQGARFEAQREDLFPMTGWRWEIRAAIASTKKRFSNDGLQLSTTTVTYNIQNKGFGPISNPASSNVIQIVNLD